MHNQARAAIPHEHPIRVDEWENAQSVWPMAVTEVLEGGFLIVSASSKGLIAHNDDYSSSGISPSCTILSYNV